MNSTQMPERLKMIAEIMEESFVIHAVWNRTEKKYVMRPMSGFMNGRSFDTDLDVIVTTIDDEEYKGQFKCSHLLLSHGQYIAGPVTAI